MNPNETILRDAPNEVISKVQARLTAGKWSLTLADLASHAVYDSARDCVTFTLRGIPITFERVTRPDGRHCAVCDSSGFTYAPQPPSLLRTYRCNACGTVQEVSP
jgi:hypothetical protein